jgi:hypothetical protein
MGTENHFSFILGVEGDPQSGVTVRAQTVLGCIPPLQLIISPAVRYYVTRKMTLLAAELMASAAV